MYLYRVFRLYVFEYVRVISGTLYVFEYVRVISGRLLFVFEYVRVILGRYYMYLNMLG